MSSVWVLLPQTFYHSSPQFAILHVHSMSWSHVFFTTGREKTNLKAFGMTRLIIPLSWVVSLLFERRRWSSEKHKQWKLVGSILILLSWAFYYFISSSSCTLLHLHTYTTQELECLGFSREESTPEPFLCSARLACVQASQHSHWASPIQEEDARV